MVNHEEHQKRGIYLLPNLFTTACLFAVFTPSLQQRAVTLPLQQWLSLLP